MLLVDKLQQEQPELYEQLCKQIPEVMELFNSIDIEKKSRFDTNTAREHIATFARTLEKIRELKS